MKTMTCKQLGGPCGHEHQGESANDVIKAQDQHLRSAVTQGDLTHAEALEAMKGRWKHPRMPAQRPRSTDLSRASVIGAVRCSVTCGNSSSTRWTGSKKRGNGWAVPYGRRTVLLPSAMRTRRK